MAIITVGAGQQFSTVSAAVAASHDGDVIDVQAGTYVNDFPTVTHAVTIEGVGGFAHFVATGSIPNGKAILLDDAANLTLVNLEFSGAQVGDGNGAGIRYEAGNLTIQNSYFHDNEEGILGGTVNGGNVTITSSAFVHNGAGDGQTHGAYLGHINSLTVTNSFFQDQLGGSDVKSRAAFTLVDHNQFIDTDSSSDETNYQIDLPEGGNDTVTNNMVLKSTYPNNFAIIHFGGEIANATGSLLVQGNTFFSGRDPSVVITNQTTGQPIRVLNNAIDTHDIHTVINGSTANTTISGSTSVDIFTQAPSKGIVLPGIAGAVGGGGSPASGSSGGAGVGSGGAAPGASEGALIDTGFYLSQNPDVAAAGVDPVAHFEQYGWHEGRDPNAYFDVGYYLESNPDVAAAGIDPLLHYALYGWKEGRNPSGSFNTSGYLAANGDVKLAGMDPLQHFLDYGIYEGRGAGF